MSIYNAKEGKEYIISGVETLDEATKSFLFSLGCYTGEPITVITHLKNGCIVSIKDSRYHIDKQLAQAIAI
ncbi:MAG: ferrous iron transport protein A [Ruminococcaceae bacterium]|nr:ferrous iron transport protein A [Oscillospiraceae bacterium]